jgi:transposase
MGNGTWVGLDVHAKSVVAGLIQDNIGELRVVRAPHRTDELLDWIAKLDCPVRVAYEAGPTGFGLARALEAAGIGCVVAAPSLIARSPAGRNKKNDAHDAEHLARLLRQGELVAVRVPDPADEAARDLVRAREDARTGSDARPAPAVKTVVAPWRCPRIRPRLDACPRDVAAPDPP